MKVISVIVCLFYPLLSGYAQQPLTPLGEDFDHWYDVKPDITADGKWAVLKKNNRHDSLFVIDTQTSRQKTFANSTEYELDKNSAQILLKDGSGWLYGNFRENTWTRLPEKIRYYFNKERAELLWQDLTGAGTFDPVTGTEQRLVTAFACFIKDTGKGMVYIKEENGLFTVYWLDKKSLKSSLVTVLAQQPVHFVFDLNREVFAFGTKTDDGTKHIFAATGHNGSWEVKQQRQYNWNGNRFLLYAQKGSVYFETRDSLNIKPGNAAVEVRNTLDEEEPPSYFPQVVWQFETGQETLLYHAALSEVFNTAVPDVFVGFNKSPYDPGDCRSIERADLLLLNAKKELLPIEKEVQLLQNHVLIHPERPYILYYKEGFWWSYHLRTGAKVCLNKKAPYAFENFEKDYLSDTSHCGALGWGSGESVLLYDAFDIWKFSLDGKSFRKVTDGKKRGLVYRNAENVVYKSDFLRALSVKLQVVPDENNLLCQVYDKATHNTGISSITNLKKEQVIVPAGGYSYQMVQGTGTGDVFIKRSGHHLPPQFMIAGKKGDVKWTHQSNPHYRKERFGNARLFDLTLKDGKTGKAALFYPTDFEPGKKYPVIVYYYEKTTYKINDFVPPTYANQDGFNRTLLNREGFFVLNTDMRYADNEVSKYLLMDTDSILDQILDLEPSVDGSRAGMFGFSFGGYEVMYLAGQSNRFKAAVAGAGVSDLYDSYYEEKDKGSLGMAAMENVQLRTDAPFNNPNFDKMNPLRYVQNINTPMLLFCGVNDFRIRKEHSIKMYLGLKKQKKEAQLLLYKNEFHSILKPENQKDLTLRILDFYRRKLQ